MSSGARTDRAPIDAWWDAKDQEWVHGAKDAEGRLVGEVRYWNADGDLISTAEHVAGKPHGIARRYYKNGELAQDSRYEHGVITGERTYARPSDPAITADGQLARLLTTIATHVCYYEAGDLVGQRYFTSAGLELDSTGREVPPRPPGIPPTAFAMQGAWYWHRGRGEQGTPMLEAREYSKDGVLLRENDYRTGHERAWYDNGVLRHEGARATGASHHLVGTWRHYDRAGQIHRESTYDGDRAGVRETYRIWHRDGTTRRGAVDGGVEVGTWTVRDATGETTWDLGHKVDLLNHAVCDDTLDDGYLPEPRDRSLPATIARARRAGITGDLAELGLDPGPAWQELDDQGHPRRLDHRPVATLSSLVHALRWGPPDAALLAEIAAMLFRSDCAAAALDLADASLLVSPDPAVAIARATYLRALGRVDEADRAVARPHRLDARALELLAEIRANPDDDAPRLVFADHVAAQFPEHAAVIVAQCHGRDDTQLIAALRDTLPIEIHRHARFVRGFLDDLRYLEAEAFVTGDPDIPYRLAPDARSLDLRNATKHIAALVTMPALRRYRELSFSDTYLDATTVEQLAGCPHLEYLEDLNLYGCGLGDEDLAILATGFPNLQSLDLTYGREDQDYTIAGIRALLTARFASTLQVLDVAGRWMGDELVEVIEQFPALVAFDLSRNELTDLSALRLATWPRELTSLRVENNQFSDDAKRALVLRWGERVEL